MLAKKLNRNERKIFLLEQPRVALKSFCNSRQITVRQNERKISLLELSQVTVKSDCNSGQSTLE